MAEPLSTGWHYVKSGAATNQQVGPLTWEQLHDLRSSGQLQPADLVWHPTMPQWLPAIQVTGLYPPAPPSPVYQQTPYPQAWQPPQQGYGGYPPAAQKRASIAPWLIPLIALILVGGGLGAYFGVWYHKGGPVSASELAGIWEGTLKYESLDLKDASQEDLALRDATLGKEIPATLTLNLDGYSNGTAATELAQRMTVGEKKGSGTAELVGSVAEDQEISGTAVLTMDLTVVDESYGEVSDNMSFTYSGNKLTFQSEDLESGRETVTATVSRNGDLLSMKGTMTFEDETGSGRAGWTVSKESPATDSSDPTDWPDTTDSGGGGDDTGGGTAATDADDTGTIAPTDLNGTWNGTLTVTSFTGDPWAARGLTAALLGTLTGLPIPVTMNITADESGSGNGQMVVSATALGAAFDIGTADMPLTTSGTTLTFQPESWPWGVPTMTGEVTQAGGALMIEGTFSYESAASTFDAVFNLTK